MTEEIRRSGAGLPAVIGRYRVTGRLGKGAMGVVYSAHDDQMDRDVAIKVLMADLESEPEIRARFYREAQVTSQLLHRNVITVFDMGQQDGRLYIVMELLKGETLSEHLKNPDHRQIEQKIDLMIQTCEGLSAAHAKGIVHRDIKPGNLFVQKDGALKILDFGVARIASSNMTASGLILGTPDYMSPEQASGKTVDARSDIFSAAAVFYFMLTGRKPFEAPALPFVLRKVLNEAPPPISEHEAPPALIKIVMKALEKDPAARYQRFTDLAADLIRFRRQYETETRHAATSVRERVELLGRMLSEVETTRAALGLPAASGLNAAVSVVRERYPFLYSGSDVAPLVVPLRRSQIAAILGDIDAVLGPIEQAVERLRATEAAVRSGEHELESGNASAALPQFEAAAGSLGERAPRIQQGIVEARKRVGEQRERQQRAEQLLVDCRSAERAEDWPAVVRVGEEVLVLDPASTAVPALIARARSQMAAAAAARAKRVSDLLDETSRSIGEQQFDQADRLLAQARDLAPDDDRIAAAHARVIEARQAAEVREAEARAAREAIAGARASFPTDREGAIARLEAFAVAHPGATDVAAELQVLKIEAMAVHRRLEAAAFAEQAQESWAADAPAEALRQAEASLDLDPANDTAQRVLALARARLKEQAEAVARAEQARLRVDQAKRFVAERKLDKAVRELQRALELQPDNAEAAAGIENVRRRLAEEEAERKRAEAAARSAEARTHVDRGLSLLKAGKADKAAREVQRALELEPGRPDAVAALEQVHRHQEEVAAARREAEAGEARARAMERELEAARAALKQRDFTRAAQATEKALRLQDAHRAGEPGAPEAASGGSRGTVLLAPFARIPRPALLGGAAVVVSLIGFLLFRSLGPSAPPGPSVPTGRSEATPAATPGSSASTAPTPAAAPVDSDAAQPAPDANTKAAVAPAANDTLRSDAPRGPQPTVPRRQGESIAAWYARDREVSRRYDRAKASLDAREFEPALSAFTEIERLEPGYRDVPALTTAAREGLHAAAQQAMDAAAKADAASDWPSALQHYERASRLDAAVAPAADEAARNVRSRMAKEGEKAFSAAGVYDALGRTAEAIAMYERAIKYLPADSPNVKTAKERLEALRK